MNPKIEVEIGAKINDLKAKLKETDTELKKTGKSFDSLNSFAKGALAGIASAFTVSAVVNFGKAVLDTTAKFQKFEAVLTNTLGSSSEAQLALIQIQDFASKTPFAVDELTQSFVKLANQGFKPTLSELRSLGDLASSTGKSFDQLAEAIIDAQVGEFERLKEFGIRAKKEGDNVTFTFKGVETQVKATDSAIRGYVLSLGDAEGVSGAMASISGTLGGKISNLGDNIEQLKLAIGSKTSGVFAASIDWLNQFISLATSAAKGVAQIRDEASQSKIGAVISANRKQVEELAESYAKLNPASTEQANLAKAIADVSRSFREAADGGEAFKNQSYTFSELKQIVEGFNSLSIELLNVSKNTQESGNELKTVTKEAEKLKRIYQDISNLPSIGLPGEGREELAAKLRARREQLQSGGQTGQTGPELINSTLAGIQEQGIFTSLPQNAEAIAAFQEQYQSIAEQTNLTTESLVSGFSALGNQIAASLDIGNDALKGFLGTVLSNTPKIIQAIFKQAAAKKAAAAIENQANLQVATGNALVSATEAAKGLGPIGLALLPVFIGGALALISGAFKKGGGGGGGAGGVGTSGISQGTSFTGQGQGATGFNRDLTLRTEIDMDRLVFYIDQAKAAQI